MKMSEEEIKETANKLTKVFLDSRELALKFKEILDKDQPPLVKVAFALAIIDYETGHMIDPEAWSKMTSLARNMVNEAERIRGAGN